MSFLVETHFHTAEVSRCGKVRAAAAVRLYKTHGYHAIVVTDHFCMDFFERLDLKTWDEKVDAYLAGYLAAVRQPTRAGECGVDPERARL